MGLIKLIQLVFLQSILIEPLFSRELPGFNPVVMGILKSENYSNQLVPPFDDLSDSKLVVYINLGLREIENIDDQKMEMKVQLSLRQKWTDKRLIYDSKGAEGYVTLHADNPHKPWVPDTFISNDKDLVVHSIARKNSFYRVYPNGTIHFSTRISLTISCFMNLHDFPFDTQTCEIRLASYAYPSDTVDMEWDPYEEPLEQIGSGHLTQFQLLYYNAGKCVMPTKAAGNFSAIFVSLTFQRLLGYHIVNFFTPCMLCVSLTWITFWLGSSVEARLSLTVTILLTLATQSSGLNQTMTQVSYLTAFSIFTGMSLLFAALSIFETALVFALIKRGREQTTKKKISAVDVAQESKIEEDKTATKTKVVNLESVAVKIDQACKFIFPASYFTFLVIFFSVYLATYFAEAMRKGDFDTLHDGTQPCSKMKV